jgi:hypothetical protein
MAAIPPHDFSYPRQPSPPVNGGSGDAQNNARSLQQQQQQEVRLHGVPTSDTTSRLSTADASAKAEFDEYVQRCNAAGKRPIPFHAWERMAADLPYFVVPGTSPEPARAPREQLDKATQSVRTQMAVWNESGEAAVDRAKRAFNITHSEDVTVLRRMAGLAVD